MSIQGNEFGFEFIDDGRKNLFLGENHSPDLANAILAVALGHDITAVATHSIVIGRGARAEGGPDATENIGAVVIGDGAESTLGPDGTVQGVMLFGKDAKNNGFSNVIARGEMAEPKQKNTHINALNKSGDSATQNEEFFDEFATTIAGDSNTRLKCTRVKVLNHLAATYAVRVDHFAGKDAAPYLSFENIGGVKKLGLNGATPIARPTLPPAATDLQSALELLNDIRSFLKGRGDCQ